MLDILVVEDEAAHAELIRRAFSSQAARFSLIVVSSLAEARSRLAASSPALVITDWRLPDGQGSDLLSGEGGQELPVILMTSFGDETLAVNAIKQGAADYVVKSASMFDELPRIVERALREWANASQRKRAEEELRRISTIQSLILDNSAVGIAFIRDRCFEWVNLRTAEHLGRTVDQIQGKSVRLFYANDEEWERTGRAAYAAMARGERFEDEVLAQRRDGTPYWARIQGKALDPDHPGNGSIWIFEDIDARKRSEEQLRALNRQLENVIEFLPDATFIVDREKRIIAWNRAIEELTGVPKEDILGKVDSQAAVPFAGVPGPMLIDVLDCMDEDAIARYSFLEKQGETLVAERHAPALHHGAGAYIWAKASPLYDPQGGLSGAIESIRDITARVHAEQNLRNSEERFRDIANNIPGIVYQFYAKASGEWGIRFVSERSEAIFGVPSDPVETYFDRMRDRISQEDLGKFLESIQTSVREASGWDFEGGFVTPGGEWKCIRGLSVPQRHGSEVVFNGILLDVTERARAEATLRESQARYQQLFESSPVSLWEEDFSEVKAYLDRLHDAGVEDVPAHLATHPEVVRHCAGLVKILNVNQATVDLLKAKDKQDLELHLPDLFTERSYVVFRDELIAFMEGRTVFESEAVHMTLAGDLKPIECRMTIPPGYEQSFGRVLVSLQDIAERKRAEETSRIHQEQLEALVELRTSELRSALERAEAATRAKSVFLANMSHELRTPLNAVIGYAQLLTHTARDPESRANLERILRASEHLLGLINDVLSLSRIEAGRLVLHPEPFETGPFFKDIENLTLLKAQAKRLAFRMELGPSLPAALHGDAQKLRQVLVNLLGNAVKFTQAGSVTLRVTREQELTCFEVLDTGVGIPEQDLDRLFRPFEQLGAPAGHAEGTGLGLHISQAMVHLMGGMIEVRSEAGRGSTFRFAIRLPEAASDAARRARRRVVGLSGGQSVPSILVVDDVLDSRCLLRDLFSSMGLPVDTASSGDEAVARWEAARPDVVWMDLRMPGMSGWEATRRIREREAELGGPRTTLIALTASAMNLDVEGLREAGFDDWVLKPIQELILFEKLASHRGLRFIAEEDQAPPRELDPGALRQQDPAWISDFRRLLTLGDTDQMLALLDQLPDRSLAGVIQVYVMEYRYGALKDLLDQDGGHP